MLSQELSQKDKLTPSYSLLKEYGIFSTEYITQTLLPLLLSQRLGRSQKSLPHVFTFLQGISSASTFSNGSVALTEALNHPDDVIRCYQFLLNPPMLCEWKGQSPLKRLSCFFPGVSLIMSFMQVGCLTHQPCLPV